MFLIFFSNCYGQEKEKLALWQSMLDLFQDVRVLCLAAKPGDEEGGILSYFRKEFGCKTYILFFTKGEGSENFIGPELYQDLARIHMEEISEASKILDTKINFIKN